MSTTTELRELASALPGVEEGTHFRLAALRVSGTVFAVLQSDDHAVLHVDAATAEDAAVHPAVEQTHRGTTLIGIRIHPPDTTETCCSHSWPPRGATARQRLKGTHF